MYDPQYLPATPKNEVEWLMQRGEPPNLNDIGHIKDVIEAIECLTPIHRAAIEAKFYEGISYAKLGERLRCSKPHAWRITQRAIAELGRQLRIKKHITERYSMFNNWEDAMFAVLEMFNSGAMNTQSLKTNRFITQKNELMRIVNSKEDEETICEVMKDMGFDAVGYLKLIKEWDFQEMGNLLIMKQHDYGHENILNFGQIGLAVRVCDKVARLVNLVEKNAGPMVNGESTIDTYRDIVGYAVLSQMLDNSTFELELGGNYE